MKRLPAIALFLLLAQPAMASGLDCETDMNRFDYLSSSPQEFMQGRPGDIKRAYQAMIELVPNPSSVKQATQYFVELNQYHRVIARPCEGELCRGRDTLRGLNECSLQTSAPCRPLAAIKDGKIYCTLKPAFEHSINQPPFRPFE